MTNTVSQYNLTDKSADVFAFGVKNLAKKQNKTKHNLSKKDKTIEEV